jgi:hypothetical protein
MTLLHNTQYPDIFGLAWFGPVFDKDSDQYVQVSASSSGGVEIGAFFLPLVSDGHLVVDRAWVRLENTSQISIIRLLRVDDGQTVAEAIAAGQFITDEIDMGALAFETFTEWAVDPDQHQLETGSQLVLYVESATDLLVNVGVRYRTRRF